MNYLNNKGLANQESLALQWASFRNQLDAFWGASGLLLSAIPGPSNASTKENMRNSKTTQPWDISSILRNARILQGG